MSAEDKEGCSKSTKQDDSDERRETQKRKRHDSATAMLGFATGASPPRFVSFDELMSAARGLDNMALAHEIAVNPQFKLEAAFSESAPTDFTTSKVRSIVHQVFWDVLKEELDEKPPDYDHALKLLAEIKEILLSLLLPRHTKLRTELEEGLDLEHIRQQVDHDVFEFKKCADFIISVMSRLCAPARDEKIAELKHTTELVPLFKGIYETLDLLKLDMTNFTIDAFRPLIQHHSIEYEREQFTKYLELNPNGLATTESWLAKAFSDERKELLLDTVCSAETSNARPSKVPSVSQNDSLCSVSSTFPSATATVCRGFWNLLETEQPIPETLAVDAARLHSLREQFLKVILTAASIMVTVPSAKPDNLTEFKEKLKENLWILLENVHPEMFVETLHSISAEVCKHVPEVSKNDLNAQIIAMTEQTQAVRKLCRDRIKGFVMPLLKNPTTSPVRVPPGLNIVQKELAQATGALIKISNHNRSVFGEIYDRIISTILEAAKANNSIAPVSKEVQSSSSHNSETNS